MESIVTRLSKGGLWVFRLLNVDVPKVNGELNFAFSKIMEFQITPLESSSARTFLALADASCDQLVHRHCT